MNVYQRRRSRALLAVLVLLTLVLVTIDFRSGDQGPFDRVRGLATAVFGPVQDGLSTLVQPIGTAIDNVTGLFSLREENARLRARLEALEERRTSFAELERQNGELRALLGLKERAGYEGVTARTVGWSSSNYEWTVTLDVGAADGVALDMPVVNPDGLVGRVVQVTDSASRVLLAVDPNFSASARTGREGEAGTVEGQGSKPLLFRTLDPEAALAVGDEVVTSRFENGIFPSGIPVGTIEEIGEANSLLVRDVLVRPYVDFTRLDVVLVVQNAPIEPPPPLGDEPEEPLDLGRFRSGGADTDSGQDAP
ncbi:MAG: rod shape-determining protein MreC [Nitriliruptorales bacterium]|nr:rod shape-determining protein MreC [Nitriliruptorales bacterium]